MGGRRALGPTADLRVLVDATALPANRAGVARYVDELVAALPGQGARLAVVAQPRDEVHYRGLVGANQVHVIPRWAAAPAARLGWEQTGLPALIRRLRPDVLLSPHYTLPLAAALPRLGVPVVVTVHDATFFSDPAVHTPVKRRFFTAWTRTCARLADALVVPSRATRDEVIRYAAADPARVHVVPHGVDHDRFQPPGPEQVTRLRTALGLEPDAAYLAFLGTLEPRKNVPALVEAFVTVCAGRPDPPVLVLAGGRGWDERVDAAVAAVPAPLRVIRPGFVDDELVPALLGGAELVVYPSRGEGFGLPVLEAMACGAAVLTTPLLSLPEVGGEAVEYAASPAPADVADALRRLLDEPDRRAQLRRLAPERAAGFTWEAAAAGHLAVLRAVCGADEDRGNR